MDLKAVRRLKHRSYVRLPAVALRHRAIFPHDVFVLSFPRSGNTWVRFMLTHLLLGRHPEFDEVFSRIPPVGWHRHAPAALPDGGRLIKSHERPAWPYAGAYRRAVYLVRDGRDVSVSYYHWYLRGGLYGGGFERFLRLFLAGRLDGFGAWHDHVRAWRDSAAARAGALRVIRYEDLLARPTEELGRIAEFVGLEVSSGQLEDAVSSSTVERTRGRPLRITRARAKAAPTDVRGIVRGTSGQWTDVLTPAQSEMFRDIAGEALAELGYEREEPLAASAVQGASPRSHG
jgi:estrone sulfotransferase